MLGSTIAARRREHAPIAPGRPQHSLSGGSAEVLLAADIARPHWGDEDDLGSERSSLCHSGIACRGACLLRAVKAEKGIGGRRERSWRDCSPGRRQPLSSENQCGTIQRWERLGLPVIRVGTVRMHDPASVREWLRSRERRQDAPGPCPAWEEDLALAIAMQSANGAPRRRAAGSLGATTVTRRAESRGDVGRVAKASPLPNASLDTLRPQERPSQAPVEVKETWAIVEGQLGAKLVGDVIRAVERNSEPRERGVYLRAALMFFLFLTRTNSDKGQVAAAGIYSGRSGLIRCEADIQLICEIYARFYDHARTSGRQRPVSAFHRGRQGALVLQWLGESEEAIYPKYLSSFHVARVPESDAPVGRLAQLA